MRKKLIIACIAILLALIMNAPFFERFTITDGKSGAIVFLDKVENYREFYTSFTHSVNRTPVNEYYKIIEGKIVLYKATFCSYGAGMPEAGEYGSGKPAIVDGMVQIEDINKVFQKFTLFAGTYANHSLNNKAGKIFFTQFVRPQTPVTFEVRKVSLLALLKFR